MDKTLEDQIKIIIIKKKIHYKRGNTLKSIKFVWELKQTKTNYKPYRKGRFSVLPSGLQKDHCTAPDHND